MRSTISATPASNTKAAASTSATRWSWEAEAGDDTHTACYRGSRAQLELRQGLAEGYRSQLYVVPAADIAAALGRRIEALQAAYPGVGLIELGREWRVDVPDQ